MELESEEMDDESNCDEDNVSLVELRVVAIDPFEAIVVYDFCSVAKRRKWREGREGGSLE